MHILAQSSLLWPFLNKVIIFFDISLGCMLKLCLKWKLDCNYYQYLSLKSPLNNYTPRSPIDYFSALLRLILRLAESALCFIGPSCEVGGNGKHLRLRMFLSPCSRHKFDFLIWGEDRFLHGIRIEFCLVVDITESWPVRAGKRDLSLSLECWCSVKMPWGKEWPISWVLRRLLAFTLHIFCFL